MSKNGHWKTVTVGELTELSAGGTPSTENLNYWKDGTIPWMSSGEVHKKRIFNTEKKFRNLVTITLVPSYSRKRQ